MTATAAEITQVRNMVSEPTTTTYSNLQIQTFIELYPMLDSNGESPYDFDDDTETINIDWVPIYNLNLAAADIWEEKAAASASQFDFDADGASYKNSQISAQCLKMAEVYRSKRINGARLLPSC